MHLGTLARVSHGLASSCVAWNRLIGSLVTPAGLLRYSSMAWCFHNFLAWLVASRQHFRYASGCLAALAILPSPFLVLWHMGLRGFASCGVLCVATRRPRA